MLYLAVLWWHTIDLQVEHTALLPLSRVTWQSVIAASAVEESRFLYRDIITNAINRSALQHIQKVRIHFSSSQFSSENSINSAQIEFSKNRPVYFNSLEETNEDNFEGN